jgi:hypothetical protein
MREGAGLGVLAVGAVLAIGLTPWEEWAHVSAPEVRALYGYLLTLAALALMRLHPRGAWLEQVWLAIFLAAMPFVYLEAAWRVGAPLPLQVAGLGVFLALAWAGLRWPWLLVAGIALHGLGWDLPHLHRGVVADWYTLGCAVVDLSLAGYAASRVPAWRGAVSPPPRAVSPAGP